MHASNGPVLVGTPEAKQKRGSTREIAKCALQSVEGLRLGSAGEKGLGRKKFSDSGLVSPLLIKAKKRFESGADGGSNCRVGHAVEWCLFPIKNGEKRTAAAGGLG